MINPKRDNMDFGISILIEITSESLIRYENLFCTTVNISKIFMYIFYMNEPVSHMEILWKFGVKCRRIRNMLFLAHMSCHESDRTFCHYMDIVRLDQLDQLIYMMRIREWKMYLTISEKGYNIKIIRRNNMQFDTFGEICTKILQTSRHPIYLLGICIRQNQEFFHKLTKFLQ